MPPTTPPNIPHLTYEQHLDEVATLLFELYEQTEDAAIKLVMAAQADDFFASPTTVRMNITGSTQYVSNASLVFGLRIVGD